MNLGSVRRSVSLALDGIDRHGRNPSTVSGTGGIDNHRAVFSTTQGIDLNLILGSQFSLADLGCGIVVVVIDVDADGTRAVERSGRRQTHGVRASEIGAFRLDLAAFKRRILRGGDLD